MISLIVGTNTNRTTVIVDANKTPREIFAENKVKLERATIYLDGVTLSAADMAKSIKDLGASDGATLVAVTKMDNAQ
jgi:hypothetical protein